MATGFSRAHYPPHRSRTSHAYKPPTKLQLLERKIRRNCVYTPISHFYHVTDYHSKASIVHDRKLYGSVAKMTQPPSIRSPIHGQLSGVFFSCNLSKKGYGLPRISPFGSERIKIPITRFASSKFHLFYNSHHKTYKRDIYYVILVLVKESDPDYKYCKAHMTELSMTSNHFLRLDFRHGTFEYCDPTEFTLWVEIFVVGNVSLTGTPHKWDTVIDIGRSDEHDDDDSDEDDSDDYDDDDDSDSDDDHDYNEDSDANYDDDYGDELRYNGYDRYMFSHGDYNDYYGNY